jgi:hypothetical protein
MKSTHPELVAVLLVVSDAREATGEPTEEARGETCREDTVEEIGHAVSEPRAEAWERSSVVSSNFSSVSSSMCSSIS